MRQSVVHEETAPQKVWLHQNIANVRFFVISLDTTRRFNTLNLVVEMNLI